MTECERPLLRRIDARTVFLLLFGQLCPSRETKERDGNRDLHAVPGSYSSPMVEMGGVEPPSESVLTGSSPGADGYLHSLIQAGADTLMDLVAS